MHKSTIAAAVFFASSLSAALPAVAVVTLWDETVNGDLTGDRLNPQPFSLLNNDTYAISATSQQGDREYFSLTIPSGKALAALNLVSYVGQDGTAFIGVMTGSTFTEPPTGTNVANLLGYTHFGTGPGNVGTNILPSIGTGAGAVGFTGSLPAGTYTFWSQQTSSLNPSTYRFEFVVVPEPSVASLLLGAGLALRRRARS